MNSHEIKLPEIVNLTCPRCHLTWMNRYIDGKYYFCYNCSFILFDRQVEKFKKPLDKMHIKWYTHIMRKLIGLFLVILCLSPVYADFIQEQRHEHVLAYADYIREKIVNLPSNSTIEVLLKNGIIIQGIFESYTPYDDTVWVRPMNTKSIFAAKAFDVLEIYDIVVIVIKPV